MAVLATRIDHLTVDEVNARIAAWLTAADRTYDQSQAFQRGDIVIHSADGTNIQRGPEPGVVLLDGQPRYSAAWL